MEDRVYLPDRYLFYLSISCSILVMSWSMHQVYGNFRLNFERSFVLFCTQNILDMSINLYNFRAIIFSFNSLFRLMLIGHSVDFIPAGLMI